MIYKLFRKAQIEPECLIAAVIYMDKIREKGLYLNSHNYRKLIFIVLMMASKTWDDISCSSKSFSICCQFMTLKEICQGERIIAQLLEYKLMLEQEDYRNYYYDLKKIWINILLDENLNIIGMTNNEVNFIVVNSKWAQWGINVIFNINNATVQQMQNINS